MSHKKHYTWADYQALNGTRRCEIIGGTVYEMSPSPTWRHQEIIRELMRQMLPHFVGAHCALMQSPLDVRLSDQDIVQPDLLVVCDPSRIKPTHVEGPPNLVIEVLSPSTATRDRLLKLNLYARAGVREYWIVSPDPGLVEVLVLEAGRYVVEQVLARVDTLESPRFPELKIRLAEVFNFPAEPGAQQPGVAEACANPYRADQPSKEPTR